MRRCWVLCERWNRRVCCCYGASLNLNVWNRMGGREKNYIHMIQATTYVSSSVSVLRAVCTLYFEYGYSKRITIISVWSYFPPDVNETKIDGKAKRPYTHSRRYAAHTPCWFWSTISTTKHMPIRFRNSGLFLLRGFCLYCMYTIVPTWSQYIFQSSNFTFEAAVDEN